MNTSNQRLSAVWLGLVGLLALLWLRCAWLQVAGSGRAARLAHAQHWTSKKLPAPRGTIYDREGRVLAMSASMSSVFANARRVADKRRVAASLAKVLERSPDMLTRQLSRDKGFVWLSRHVEPDVSDRLAAFRRQGIGVMEEMRRVYPQGRLAGHVLGFVDIDQRGLEGMELALDGVLRGRPGWMSTRRDARGQAVLGPWTAWERPQPGYDVVLTIDSVVQAIAEEALAWGVERFHAKGGSIVVMDPSTGAILALANQPDVDPNAPGRSPMEHRRLRAVTDLFEPGSVFKIVTAAALLEEGKAQPQERVYCEQGHFKTVGRHILHDHRPHGWLSFHDVIALSSNIGTAKLAQRLEPGTLYRYIRAFGFGRKTGIEFHGEINGIVPPPSRWSKLSPYMIPIGQEVAVTPIQLAQMMALVANGGARVHPYVIERLQTADGRTVRRFQRPAPQRVLRPETVSVLHEMLTSVVESGTGQLAKVKGLTVAGKTGTAQKVEPDGRYSHSRFVASFVGYGPVPDPRFVLIVSVDEPRPLYFGGVVAAPVFRRVVERLAGYWEMPPAAPSSMAVAKSR